MSPLSEEQRQVCADLAGTIAKEAEACTYSDKHYRQVFLSRLAQRAHSRPMKVATPSYLRTAGDAAAAELAQIIRSAVEAAVVANRAASHANTPDGEAADEREMAAFAIIASALSVTGGHRG